MQPPLVLVVSEDGSVRQQLAAHLAGEAVQLELTDDPREALATIELQTPQAVIVDLSLTSLPASEFLSRGRALTGQQGAFVALDRSGAGSHSVAALEAGAEQALQWPEHAAALPVVVRRALEKPALARAVERAREGAFGPLSLARLGKVVGGHPTMQRLLGKVVQAAQSRATVLMHGETGTGKELIASAVHENSKRADGPFVRLNCAALAESVLESELFGHERGAFTGATTRRKGRFEQADRGTLFLDEVSEVSPAVQVKLLRFLQEREFERLGSNETIRVDVRIVAATNRDLKQLVEEGRFRQDLYYRLNVVRLDVPPLRARPSDIPLLADHFLRRFAAENDKEIRGFTHAATEALLAHPWPGNVRELQNAIEQAVVLCCGDMVDERDLPIAPAPQELDPLKLMIPGVTLAELERYAILKTLESCGNSPTRAAAVLGVSRRTIQYRLQEWGLSRPPRQGSRGDEAEDALPGDYSPGEQADV